MTPKRDLESLGLINIEAPNAYEVSWANIEDAVGTGDNTTDGDDSTVGNGMPTNGKELFRRFEDLVAKDQFKFDKHGQSG